VNICKYLPIESNV